jgi:uncharacterized protein YjiS (DUF1127 family)
MAFYPRHVLRGAHRAAGRNNAAARLIAGMRAALAEAVRLLRIGRRVRRDLMALSRLDAHMLRDIGVSRWDVERLYAGSWDRREADARAASPTRIDSPGF